MKRHKYFPNRIAERPEWSATFCAQLPLANATLGLPAPGVTAIVADAKFCEYACGDWLTAVREFGPAATASLEELYSGGSGGAFVLPVFTAPALPCGVVAVPAGALDRIAAYVQMIKSSPAYTLAIGLQLGIVGPEDAAEHDAPTFALKIEQGEGHQVVRIAFKKFGHPGVAIESRRNGGAWELLAIDLSSPYLDARALLASPTPETREYRLRFFDGSAATGDYSPTASVVVGV